MRWTRLRAVEQWLAGIFGRGHQCLRPTLPVFEAEIADVATSCSRPKGDDDPSIVMAWPSPQAARFERREESETLLRVMEERSSLLEECLANTLTRSRSVQVVIGVKPLRELRDVRWCWLATACPTMPSGAGCARPDANADIAPSVRWLRGRPDDDLVLISTHPRSGRA